MIAASDAFFGAPTAGLAFFGVALLAAFASLRQRRRAARRTPVLGARADSLAAERVPSRDRLGNRLVTTGLACCVFAWMEPRFGSAATSGAPPAADLCVCLDVSRSMLASDFRPTRLSYAQEAIAALGERARGDRIALVLFAGEARLRVPRTNDVDSLVEIARGVDPSDVSLGGTDLGAAIDAAVRSFASARVGERGDGAGTAGVRAGDVRVGGSSGGDARDGDARIEGKATGTAPLTGAQDDASPLTGAILLVTDGEDASGSGRAAAERARARGLRVHCVGVGSPLGSKITVKGRDGRETFLRDREGNEVVTRLDATSLRALVAAGGGVYVDAGEAEAPLVAVYERGVLPHLVQRVDGAVNGESQRAARFQWPLALGVALLAAELALSRRRRVRAGGIG